MVYAKPPFAGPEAVLAYLSRYTHRVAISNRRLITFDETGVTFRYKDYRRSGPERQQVMTLAADEFIRRFLLHVLPRGFHRIRHYGLLAASSRKASLALARELLAVAPPADADPDDEPVDARPPCPCCGGLMIVIETFERWQQPRAPPCTTHRKIPRDPARAATIPPPEPPRFAAGPRSCPRPPTEPDPRAQDPPLDPINGRKARHGGPCNTADRTAQVGPLLPLTQPKIEIPIAIARGPRVRSSATFVRLPAPETLHGSCRSALRSQGAEADIRLNFLIARVWPQTSPQGRFRCGDWI